MQVVVDDNGRRSIHREAPSERWKPMRFVGRWTQDGHNYESWENSLYYAAVERFNDGFPIGGGEYVRIGITAIDETARHDWREFQWAKNDICGPEWEAVELYPAESRLLDPSNWFYLWCVPSGVLEVGQFVGRNVLNHTESKAPQRPFANGSKDWRPAV